MGVMDATTKWFDHAVRYIFDAIDPFFFVIALFATFCKVLQNLQVSATFGS